MQTRKEIAAYLYNETPSPVREKRGPQTYSINNFPVECILAKENISLNQCPAKNQTSIVDFPRNLKFITRSGKIFPSQPFVDNFLHCLEFFKGDMFQFFNGNMVRAAVTEERKKRA